MSELSELYVNRHIGSPQDNYALAQAETKTKDAALMRMADILYAGRTQILQANARDIETARASGRRESFIDRLSLDEGRIAGICAGAGSRGAWSISGRVLKSDNIKSRRS